MNIAPARWNALAGDSPFLRHEFLAALEKTGCVGGALEEAEYRSKLAAQGFVDIDVEPTRVYDRDDALALIRSVDGVSEDLAEEVDGAVMSAFIRARKPARMP